MLPWIMTNEILLLKRTVIGVNANMNADRTATSPVCILP